MCRSRSPSPSRTGMLDSVNTEAPVTAPVAYGPPVQVGVEEPNVWVLGAHWLRGYVDVSVKVLGPLDDDYLSKHERFVTQVWALMSDETERELHRRTSTAGASNFRANEISEWPSPESPASVRLRLRDASGAQFVVELRRLTT
jgi:hypothetical protein